MIPVINTTECEICGAWKSGCPHYKLIRSNIDVDKLPRWGNDCKEILQPHKCPVCDGSGVKISTIYTSTGASGQIGISSSQYTQICHGCDGKGWVQC